MNEPLLIFWAFTVRDTFQHGLDLHKTNTEAIELENHLLDKYLYTADNKLLYATVCRAPGGAMGFLAKAERLFSHFHGPVFIFHRELPMYGGGLVYPPNVFVNYPLHTLLETICVRVSDQNKSRMAAAMGSPPRFVMRVRQDEDAELQRALLASEEEHARALLLKRPPELKENIHAVLKEAEPACPGFAQCSVCFEKKATICIVDCGHQALCDDCVPKLNHHRCVICKTDIQRIVRPIYSLIMEQPPLSTKKRRRICIKK
ncbi:MAG: hypothetical protein K2Q45_00430 [Nitrosomonas sp.]|nr:hypothetical protein [Nitrosomonas sp.]